MKVYFFCTFLGYNLYFFSRIFVLFLGDEPVATLTATLACLAGNGSVVLQSCKCVTHTVSLMGWGLIWASAYFKYTFFRFKPVRPLDN